MARTGPTALMAAVALVAAACGAASDVPAATPSGTADGPTTTAASTSTTAAIDAAVTAFPVGPSALVNPRAPQFPTALVDIDEIISGGPPPDGIPPIESPVFLPVGDAIDLLDPRESVVSLEIDGDARAYPVRAMVWHEIVNDTVGGVPVSVTYCPLCNSAVTYRRVVDGNETTFGTSGQLFASALVMYDRATESLWTHFDGRAVVGMLTGSRLEPIGSPLMSWDDFTAAYPTGQVLDWTATGFNRDYGRNPYVGYDNAETQPFLFRGVVDDRARAKQRVVGVTVEGESIAYSLDALTGDQSTVTPVEIGGRDLVILWTPGQSSALDTSFLNDGRDVGSVGVFVPVVDGRRVAMGIENGLFVDEETASTWTVAGVATDGPLAGARLERIEHLDTFWFAWSTYRPETIFIEG